ncbi:MAG: universal stress protein [Candidatus Baltobacteraceae bacterium]|jgi:nucleotide-binding universal stress UspA family protein
MTSQFERILVPVDGSEPCSAAIGLALDFAVSSGGHVIFAHVLDTRDLYDKASIYGYDPRPLRAKMRAEAEDVLEPAARRAAERGVESETLVVEGRPVDAILNAAAGRSADLIVMGTHGRRGFDRLFMGSTTEGVLRAAGIPVLVVRQPQHAERGHAKLSSE